MDAELRQVPIQQVPLADIRPHPLNDKLYGPVNATDPDVRALAQSIRDLGVKEALVLTSDLVILSGHRRRVAALLAGVKTVPCRVEPVHSEDKDRCLKLLREFNRQRVKTADQIIREEVVSANPEEAHRVLVEHRRQSARTAGPTIRLEGFKGRAAISAAKGPFLEAIGRVLEAYEEHWPLTDRQIHYALLNDPPLIHASKPGSRYANDKKSYQSLCELVTRARLEREIPFEAIHDPTRPVVTWDAHQSMAPFIRREVNHFLKGYYRDLMQSQPNHVEIVGEKNTIEGIIRPVAMRFCIPYMIGRGYSSLPPRYEMAQRFERSGKEKLVLLILSDLDPEGNDIAHSFALSLRDDFDIDHVEAHKVALTAAQVRQLDLVPRMQAKAGSSRRKKFVAEHGEDVYELEAVHPQQLQEMLTEAIDRVIDVKAFNTEVEREKTDAAYLDGVRRVVKDRLGNVEGLGAEN